VVCLTKFNVNVTIGINGIFLFLVKEVVFFLAIMINETESKIFLTSVVIDSNEARFLGGVTFILIPQPIS
jgi:hypothetical protein